MDGWNFLSQAQEGNKRLTRMNFYSSHPDYRIEIGIESDQVMRYTGFTRL